MKKLFVEESKTKRFIGGKCNYSAPIGEIARSAEGELYRREKNNCHSELDSESIKKQTLNQVQGDIINRKELINLSTYSPTYSKKPAFTLAEVLITLGIIGVVAAITIPTLIANTNGAKFRSQFKKSISSLNQAVRMNEAHNDYNFDGLGAQMQRDVRNQTLYSIFEQNLVGVSYLGACSISYDNNISKFGWCPEDITTDYTFEMQTYKETFMSFYQMADGAIFGFSPSTTFFGKYSYIGFIDVNGTTKPNKEVTCSVGADTMLITAANYEECVVKNDTRHMTDIFPVWFHDSTVEPATNAAKYVLNTAK
ncbi:type II secretion system protein [bacterium]|nr:type II secretion system protein [bacterium]